MFAVAVAGNQFDFKGAGFFIGQPVTNDLDGVPVLDGCPIPFAISSVRVVRAPGFAHADIENNPV